MTNPVIRRLIGPAIAAVVLSTSTHRAAVAAKDVVGASGVRGGLVVRLGCGDAQRLAALRVNDSFLVHGLDTDPRKVERARRHLRSLGLYGSVAVDTFDGRRLPYVDNLVNLLVADDPSTVSVDEVTRVLAPRGVAILGGRRIEKPWPDQIDEWTHFLHGPTGNAVADDRVAGPPRHMQWLAGPRWTRHHHADKGSYPAIRAVVSAEGRLFYMVDRTKSSNRAVPSTWFLAARDAFSGVLLWEKPLEAVSFERRLEEVWRTLIADGDHVYAPLGTDRPLAALDADTGTLVTTYPGTEGLKEVVKDADTLFVVDTRGGILALAADSGQTLWRWEPGDEDPIVPLTLAVDGGDVFVKTDRSVSCLAANRGDLRWRVELQPAEKNVRLKWPREKLLTADGVVLCSFGGKDPTSLNRDRFQYLGSHPRVHEYGGRLAALSAEDGSRLWETAYLPGLESMPGEIYILDGQVWLGPDFAEPRDLRSGEVRQTRPVLEQLWTTGHHYRCYPGKATRRYIITAKRGIELIDLAGDDHSRNNWVRATCRVGVTPANGLLYAPPHSCGCYMEAKLFGFWALASVRGEERGEREEGERLEKGPAYGTRLPSPAGGRGVGGEGTSEQRNTPSPGGFAATLSRKREREARVLPTAYSLQPPSAWPTYRADVARSGSTSSPVPVDLKPLWKADVGGRLSAPTVAGGKLLVADVDAHTVHALDADGGEPLWHFTAGGRVDSPPTLYRDLVLFGSRDGCVYCLRASDGALVWRFLAADDVTRAVACEQVESLWPVHGSVLVSGGVAYVAAGRSSHLDGGIVLWGLDPETGRVRSTARLTSEHACVLDPPSESKRARMETAIQQNNTDYKTFLAADRSDAFSMRGALTDVMTAAGDSIFMRHLRFDARLVEQQENRPHLFSTSSLLDDSEHHRSYWVLGSGDFSRTPVAYPWIVTKSLAVPYGLMLTFDAKTVWGVHRVGKKRDANDYAVFAAPRPDPADEESRLPDFAERPAGKLTDDGSWTTDLRLRPRALVRANDRLFIAGMPRGAESEVGVLDIVSCDEGETLARVELDSPPVWDGMAAAAGRLYVVHADGRISCLAGTDHTSPP